MVRGCQTYYYHYNAHGDAETGMYYLNARYYLPSVGRFISRDSFHGFTDEPASLNQYAYAHGNPISYVDPDGQSITEVNQAMRTLVAIRLAHGIGKAVIKEAWAKAKEWIKKALKDRKRYKIVGTDLERNGRIIGIVDYKSKAKDKSVFRLDFHKYNSPHPLLHYHVLPDIKSSR